jgi:hypothetical protein
MHDHAAHSAFHSDSPGLAQGGCWLDRSTADAAGGGVLGPLGHGVGGSCERWPEERRRSGRLVLGRLGRGRRRRGRHGEYGQGQGGDGAGGKGEPATQVRCGDVFSYDGPELSRAFPSTTAQPAAGIGARRDGGERTGNPGNLM